MKDFFKVILWLALLGHPTIARSQSPDPDILTIEQASGKTATYTEKQLRSGFDLHERTTETPWSKKGQKTSFRGPLLKDILARSHLADVKEFEVVAYNDFIARDPWWPSNSSARKRTGQAVFVRMANCTGRYRSTMAGHFIWSGRSTIFPPPTF